MPTALITGAGRGLGKELARQYAEDGWRVIGTTRKEFDVTDFPAIKSFSGKIKEPIDVLISNAGISGKRGTSIGSFDYASWEEVLKVNLLGAVAVAEAFVDHVAASERKVIAFVSSRMGSIAGTSGHSLPYSSSKAALNMVVRAFSVLLAPRGITVLSLHPGWVRTDMGGPGAPVAPEESAQGLRKVLAGAKPGDSGKFISYDGSEIAW